MENMKVNFYDSVEDKFLKFAVIIAKYNGKYVFCKHKERDTYEVPGGHREIGESIEETAKRELKEETGAIDFTIKPICVYSVTGKTRVNESGEESYGGLYFAEIKTFEQELHSEMEKIIFVDEMPDKLTYPEIQPKLMEEAKKRNILQVKGQKSQVTDNEKTVTCDLLLMTLYSCIIGSLLKY